MYLFKIKYKFKPYNQDAPIPTSIKYIQGLDKLLEDKRMKSLFNMCMVMTTPEFWKDYFDYERVLIFQQDSNILRKGIEDFFEYDYVGAPCGKIVFAESGFETKNYIGNGGLSLRKKSVILNLIKNDLYNIRYNGPEDIFFSQNITNKPTFKKAILFSVESFFSEKSFGIHKCYMHLQNDQLCKIAEYIPEIFELAELNKIHHNY